jgi:polysaccharide chain length determinant protein (PEP-CTERM system associated)
MLGHRTLVLQDYLDILKRRFWLLLGSSLVCLGIGIGLTFIISPTYVSQTLVIIAQQKVPENYVKPVINEDLSARLASMKEQILSRSRLEPIIERFNLFARKNVTLDDRVEATRKAIGITPIASGANKFPGFYISFKAESARTAQQVCSEITSLFVSESLSAREQSAEGTLAFLSQQVADAKRALDDQDAKFAKFQEKYFGKLPGQEQSNMSTLQALAAQLDAVTQSIGRLHQEETITQAVVSQGMSELQLGAKSTAPSEDKLQDQLKSLTQKKNDLTATYTADHPDVVSVSREIADIKKQIDDAAAHPPAPLSASATPAADSPQLLRPKAQLRAIQDSIAQQKQEQAELTKQIHMYEARIESSPVVEQEYKQITRDHESALQFYNNLLTKMNDSSMATDLERRQQGEQFQVLDAANLPDEPVFPNPFVFAIGGFFVGLLFGSAIAAFLDYRDTSLRSEKDVRTFMSLPTLAVISFVDGLPQPARGRKLFKPASRTNRSVKVASS